MRRSRAANALLALCLLAGCRGVPPLQPLAAGDPRPRALLEAWARQTGERRALRGSARLAVDAEAAAAGGGALHFRSRQALLLARPARLRVELRSLFGTTEAVLASDGERYDFFRADDRSFESGPVYDALLWEVAGLSLTLEEAVELILGEPRLADGLAPAAAFDAGGGRVRIQLTDAAGSVRRLVDFDAEGRLRWLQERRGGAVAWEADFDDYAFVDGAPLAHSLALRLRAGRTRALLYLSAVELNPALPADIFRLEDPTPREAPGGDGG